VQKVEMRWMEIRDELLANLTEDQRILQPYVNKTMTSRPNQWKTLGLMFWTVRSAENCRKFPRTWAILKEVPGIIAISFNLLEPQTTIKPHVGNTNAIIRCHMGLVIPEQAPRCGFRVGAETRSWQNGRFLMFCDAHQHTAWNNTDQKRYILVVDIMRPEFCATTLATSSRVLASIHLEAIYQRDSWFARWMSGRRRQSASLAFFRACYWFSLAGRRLFLRS
jgi:aspartyl/asparaginyl beta-hydroxylase (cupin superfamily)